MHILVHTISEHWIDFRGLKLSLMKLFVPCSAQFPRSAGSESAGQDFFNILIYFLYNLKDCLIILISQCPEGFLQNPQRFPQYPHTLLNLPKNVFYNLKYRFSLSFYIEFILSFCFQDHLVERVARESRNNFNYSVININWLLITREDSWKSDGEIITTNMGRILSPLKKLKHKSLPHGMMPGRKCRFWRFNKN